jgi:hypothetical protein
MCNRRSIIVPSTNAESDRPEHKNLCGWSTTNGCHTSGHPTGKGALERCPRRRVRAESQDRRHDGKTRCDVDGTQGRACHVHGPCFLRIDAHRSCPSPSASPTGAGQPVRTPTFALGQPGRVDNVQPLYKRVMPSRTHRECRSLPNMCDGPRLLKTLVHRAHRSSTPPRLSIATNTGKCQLSPRPHPTSDAGTQPNTTTPSIVRTSP